MDEENILELDNNTCDDNDNSCLCQVIQCLMNNCKEGPTGPVINIYKCHWIKNKEICHNTNGDKNERKWLYNDRSKKNDCYTIGNWQEKNW